MFLTFHIKAAHFGLLNVFLLSQFLHSGLLNLRVRIRCAQNWYIAVQMDLK